MKAKPAAKAAEKKRPTTVAEYIKAAPRAAQPHLREMRAILQSVAPHATEVIKWGIPFFVEPRFLFAYSAHKSHLSLAPGATALEAFAKGLEAHDATKYMMRIPYDAPIPEALVRKLAEYSLKHTTARGTDSFW